MDSLTHLVVGACAGELLAGKQTGKKAMLLGAIANSLPDIDVIASAWSSVSHDLLVHRGFTHSILFSFLVSPLLAVICKRSFRKDDISTGKWLFFWSSLILLHLGMDCCNVYGTGLFEPFSHKRVSLNLLYVADPLFTIWPMVAAVVLILLSVNNQYRIAVAKMSLLMSCGYILLSVSFKARSEDALHNSIAIQGLADTAYFTTPTPLNDLLWYAVVRTDTGYLLGYYSVLDAKKKIQFHFTGRNDSLLAACRQDQDVNELLRFSQGYYTVSRKDGKLVFNDIRFGESGGWANQNHGFVFYYYITDKGNNDAIIQRGRFGGWDKATLQSFINRIKGI